MPVGKYGIAPGTAMAGGGFFDIAITGKGAHGARPEESIDPVLVACHIGAALQSIVSRNVSARETAVLSITRILSGDAYNVIPQTATLGGTVRTMKRETMALVEQGMRRIVSGVASAFGATAEVDFRLIFVPLVNHATEFQAIADAAAELVGDANVNRQQAPPRHPKLRVYAGGGCCAYINLGNGDARCA
jgi:hippurate hydrolase